MSDTNLEEPLNLQESGRKPQDEGQREKNVPKNKQDLVDVFSISSASPCPVKDAQVNSETKHSKVSELASGQALNRSGILVHLQLGSPLESVRELMEVEETCELGVLGDRMVLFNEQKESKEIFPATNIRYMSLTTEGLGDALGRAIMASSTKPDCATVESPMTEACSSLHEIPGLWPQEDASKVSVNECQQVERCSSTMCSDQTGHQLTPCNANSGVVEVQLDKHSSVTPLQDLLNPVEEHMCHQTGVEVKVKYDDKLGLDNKSNSEEFQGHSCEKEDAATTVANQTLTEVLTPCKAKVEQHEQLKSSSFDLSAQLHSAQVMTASLHQRVLCLEHECSLKEKELQELTANLEKTSKALEVRNSEMTTVSKELHLLHLELEAMKNPPTAARTVTANGQATLSSQQLLAQNSSSSKLCRLL
ncbi:hypothetical protein SRHO_G00273010 [Serrasalmus rhombeus]